MAGAVNRQPPLHQYSSTEVVPPSRSGRAVGIDRIQRMTASETDAGPTRVQPDSDRDLTVTVTATVAGTQMPCWRSPVQQRSRRAERR